MNNFIKYPSGSDINISEMFTKDNLVSITGLDSNDTGWTEIAVLNKDNNFSNIDSPTGRVTYFEIKFGNIGIAIQANYTYNTIIINRNATIVMEEASVASDFHYDFTLYIYSDDGEETAFELGKYYYTE